MRDSRFAEQIQPPRLDREKLQALVPDTQSAIVSFFTTQEDTHIFIVKKTGDIQILTCSGQGINQLQLYIRNNWLLPYFNQNLAQNFLAGKRLKRRYQEIDKVEIETIRDKQLSYNDKDVVKITLTTETDPIILDSKLTDNFLQATEYIRYKIHKVWETKIKQVTKNLSQRLEIDKLVNDYIKDEIKQLILVPHLDLHIIPLSILPIQNTQSEGLTLGDKYMIRTLPSCLILKFCSENEPVAITKTAIVENATDDLSYTLYECHKVKEIYQPSRQIKQLTGSEEVTIHNYLHLLEKEQINHLHTSHHASSRIDNSDYSALKLGDGEIKLADLLFMRLSQLNLVFLSCCETALGSNLQDRNDEILTIAGGFLTAGARIVISTLWAVEELATAFLAIFFYQELEREIPPVAVKKAQEKLRNLTGKEVQEYAPEIIEVIEPKLREKIDRLADLEDELADERDEKEKQLKQCQDNSSEKLRLIEEIERLEERIDKQRDMRYKLEGKLDNLELRLNKLSEQDNPFSHPYYWAGFVCQGLEKPVV